VTVLEMATRDEERKVKGKKQHSFGNLD